MPQTKESFDENVGFLRKIIQENVWFGPKDEAFEFLDAIAEGYEGGNSEGIKTLKVEIERLEEENQELHNSSNNIDPEHFTEEILPFGSFVYKHHELNLAFSIKLEKFIEENK